MDQVRDRRCRPFYWIDNTILKVYAPRIKAPGVAIYNVLCLHANRQGHASPGMETIAAESGLGSRHTVIRYLGILEAEGLIRILSRPGRAGNTYILLDVVEQSDSPRPSKPSQKAIRAEIAPVIAPESRAECTIPAQESRDSAPEIVQSARDSFQESRDSEPESRAQRARTRENKITTSDIEPDDDEDRARAKANGSSSSSSTPPAPPATIEILESEYGRDAVAQALEIAARSGRGNSLRYVAGVLRNQQREGMLPRRRRRHARHDPFDWPERAESPDDG